jgi:hypothetical protein
MEVASWLLLECDSQARGPSLFNEDFEDLCYVPLTEYAQTVETGRQPREVDGGLFWGASVKADLGPDVGYNRETPSGIKIAVK